MLDAPILFLDLDGTLIGASGDISPTLLHRLQELQDTHLCVCTGRPSGGIASAIAQAIGPNTLHAFHGGASVQDGQGRVRMASAMEVEDVVGLVEHARKTGHTLELYTPHTIYVDEHTPLATTHARILGLESREVDLLKDVELDQIIKAQWIVEEEALVKELTEQTPQGLFAAPATSSALPGVHFITVTRAGTDKGSAVRFIAQELGVSLQDCAAVGDTVGDLPMLEVVGKPYVMEEAEALLQARFSVLPGVEEDGVLALL